MDFHAEAVIGVQGLSKSFTTESGESFLALDGIDLGISEGEFVCIVGASGCGKSTLLRIMAGLEHASMGFAYYHGETIAKPDKRIGMVFQEYSLFPWLTVADNILTGPQFAGITHEEKKEKLDKYLAIIGMKDFAEALPHELSGGMRQRVAIARALANDPDVLLMDEPFGALDAHTRILLQSELLRIWELTHKTVVLVTHSVDEAVYLADRIVIMSPRPGTIRDIVKVDMPRTRSRALPEFGLLTASILSALE